MGRRRKKTGAKLRAKRLAAELGIPRGKGKMKQLSADGVRKLKAGFAKESRKIAGKKR